MSLTINAPLELQQKIQGIISKYSVAGIPYGLIWNPEDFKIYLDKPSKRAENVVYEDPVFDSLAWAKANKLKVHSERGLASSAIMAEPETLSQCYMGPFAELAEYMAKDVDRAIETHDKGLASSVITSQTYSILQDPVILGESVDTIFPGVLLQFFDDVPTPNLKGDYLDLTSGVDYYTNVPEGLLPEPSRGAGAITSIEVPKHAGGIAITERAELMIRGRNIFAELAQKLGEKRLEKENKLVANELENTTTVLAGVDFGARAGTPLTSSNVPNDLWQTLIDAFDGVAGNLNGIASRSIVWNEYKNNDYNKGFYNATANVDAGDGRRSAPGVDGAEWFTDKAIVSATKLWAADRAKAGKNFRGPVRSFDIDSPKTESRETWLKSYLLIKIVDQDYIREITGVSA
jgi:hypothetical protein